MFHHTHGGVDKKSRKSLPHLIPVVKATVMCQETAISMMIKRIEAWSTIETSRYQSLYLGLITRLVDYVERLPDSVHRDYVEQNGYLEYALQRSAIALELLRPHLLLENEQVLSEEQHCWQYALFSAALLLGIGKLYTDYQVTCYDAHGTLLKHWNPFVESLAEAGDFYTYQVNSSPKRDYRRRLNALLAERIMPEEGFTWLTSRPSIFEAWLALLDEEVGGARLLEAILTHADHLLMAQGIEALLEKLSLSKSKSFLSNDQSPLDLMTQAGLTFLVWLKQQLASGELCLNETPLSLSAEGLVLNEEVFKLFARENPTYKNWQAVQKGFLSLGFHDTNVNTAEILFAKFGIVMPAKAQLLNAVTGEKSWVSKLEAAYFVSKGAHIGASESIEKATALPILSQKGVWQEKADLAFLKPGQTHRG